MTERDERDETVDDEVPAEDALEQRTDAVEHDTDDDLTDNDEMEADEGDLAEQSRAVVVDEDDYR